jgi:hypothetical protein
MTDARKGKPARKKAAAKSKARPKKVRPKPKSKPKAKKPVPEWTTPSATWEQDAPISAAPPEADAPAPAAQTEKRSGGFFRLFGLLGFVVVIGIGAVMFNWPFWVEVLEPYLPGLKAEQAAEAPAGVPSKPPVMAEKAGATIEEMRSERQQLRQELNRLMARMETMEKSVESVKKLIQVTVTASEKGGAVKTSAALAGRLLELEKNGESIKVLLQRMDKMESDSAAQEGAGTGGAPNARAQAIVLAVANLRQAVATDEPFEKSLEALNALSSDDPDIKTPVVVLSKSSAAGNPTLAALRERFDGLAGKIVQASKTLEETGWMERATNRITSLVTWRRVGGGAEASSIDAIVSRAEARLKVGDLKGAADALEGLSAHSKAARVAAPWLKDAKARVVAERAITTLHVHAVSLLAPGKE